jgi:hypothetical protein
MMQARELSPEEMREALEHRDVVNALQAIMKSEVGRKLVKYMFKSFDVGIVPEFGLEGNMLHDRIGFLRAGQSFFQIACEAEPMVAGEMLAALEKERYHERYIEKYGEDFDESGRR